MNDREMLFMAYGALKAVSTLGDRDTSNKNQVLIKIEQHLFRDKEKIKIAGVEYPKDEITKTIKEGLSKKLGPKINEKT